MVLGSDRRMGSTRWRPKKNHGNRHFSVVFLCQGVLVGAYFCGFLAAWGNCDISVIFWVRVGGERRQGYFRDCGFCLVLRRGAKVKEWKDSSTEV